MFIQKNISIFAANKKNAFIIIVTNNDKKDTIMTATATQGVYVNVPAVDWSLFRELIRKFGWQAETREQMLDRFISSRPANPAISEDEIMKEVRNVR